MAAQTGRMPCRWPMRWRWKATVPPLSSSSPTVTPPSDRPRCLNHGCEDGLGDKDVSTYYYNYNVYGTGYSDDHGRNYAAALTQAQSIVSHSKNFYTIGISNDVTNLTKLTTEAGAGADHSKTATSKDELVEAFNEIAASIIAHLGHSDVKDHGWYHRPDPDGSEV